MVSLFYTPDKVFGVYCLDKVGEAVGQRLSYKL